MISLKKIRLINWHNFIDETIHIDEKTLLVGDNASGKSTLIDAIQYALSPNLRKAKFNSAAGDKRGGRDLISYTRCKLGSDTTEYVRGNTITHIMLFFADEAEGFTSGIFIESFTDLKTLEHFWIARGCLTDSITVYSDTKGFLNYRQFKNAQESFISDFYETKKEYTRQLTGYLGVFRRMSEYNPYLEALTRSVSFSPLLSVNNFVCDYILEERSLDVSTMKANLQSYKDAEEAAIAAKKRIDLLTKILRDIEDYHSFELRLILLAYLNLCAEKALAQEAQKQDTEKRKITEKDLAHNRLELERLLSSKKTAELDYENTLSSLSKNDKYMLFNAVQNKIAHIREKYDAAKKGSEAYKLCIAQCTTLSHVLHDTLADCAFEIDEKNIDKTIEDIEAVRSQVMQNRSDLKRTLDEKVNERKEISEELIDLQKGIRRYPETAQRLLEELTAKGVQAWILSDLVECTNEEWTNAVEGYLNTLRFAVITEPQNFQKSLEIYNSLGRGVSGVPLPNILKMKQKLSEGFTGTTAKEGSLASLISTDSPYAKTYTDYILGDVMTADISSLKNYRKAITKDCMSYTNFTASKIKEEIYNTHWLGRKSLEKRKQELIILKEQLSKEIDEINTVYEKHTNAKDILYRIYSSLHDARPLASFLEESVALYRELQEAEKELLDIDTNEFLDLQEKANQLKKNIRETDTAVQQISRSIGQKEGLLEDLIQKLVFHEEKLTSIVQSINEFEALHEHVIPRCVEYAEQKLSNANPSEILASYERQRKTNETKKENAYESFALHLSMFNRDFSSIIPSRIEEEDNLRAMLDKLEKSELPLYHEKIAQARMDAEREFKDHFIAKLNEYIEEARISFKEINKTLSGLTFGSDQYSFTLEERSDRKGQISILQKAAEITAFEDSLFEQFINPDEKKAAEDLFDAILHADLDSEQMRSICDYRTYFTYDIKIKNTSSLDPKSGKPVELSLSKVIREKSGGEAQTPYYIAIAASFYRFFMDKPESTIRLVMFDEAFDKLDDERIRRILEFYATMNIQLIVAVPTEKLETIAPSMDRILTVIKKGYTARVREHTQGIIG